MRTLGTVNSRLTNRRRAGAAVSLIAAASLVLTGCGQDPDEGSTMSTDTGSVGNSENAENTENTENADGGENTENTDGGENAESAGDSASAGAGEPTDDAVGDGVTVESIGEDGQYGAFRDDARSFEGDRVTVSAKVNRVLSSNAFSIGGIEDADVEPMLVVHKDGLGWLEKGMPVVVTGLVHKAYDVALAEDQVGMELKGVTFEEWGAEPYIEADTVGELRE